MLIREKNPIYKHRQKHDISIIGLSRLLEPPMDRANLTRFEQGNTETISFSVIQRFAMAMNVDALELQKALTMWKYYDQEYNLEELNEDKESIC